jgi:hypothetical protein
MAGESGGGHGATTGVWIAVALVIAGSIVMAIGLIEWIWPMFWVGAGLMVLGTVGAYFANIMDMVSEFSIAERPAEAESA